MREEGLIMAETKIRRKKPAFVVKESHNVARVKKRWRLARGRHSQVRQMHKGKPPMPNPGYGVPKAERGLHSSGLIPLVVKNTAELSAIDSSQYGAILSSKIGKKNKIVLLEMAAEKKIKILNVKDVSQSLAQIKSEFEARKKQRQNKLQKKSQKEEEKKKKAEEKKQKDEEEKNKEAADKREGKDKKEPTGTAPRPPPLEEAVGIPEENDKEKKQKEIAEKTIIKKQ